MGEHPQLISYEFDADKYDRIILASPVWASNFAPPLRTFINENPKIREKNIAAVLCYSGGGSSKALDKLRRTLNISKFEIELVLIDPKENMKQEDEEKIDAFCIALKEKAI